jgi:cysteine synthase B
MPMAFTSGSPLSKINNFHGLRPIVARAWAHYCGTDPPRRVLSTQACFPIQNSARTSAEITFRTSFEAATMPEMRIFPAVVEAAKVPLAGPLAGLELPFDVPAHSALRKIGGTPVVAIDGNIHCKLEGLNPSGSIKDRAVTNTVLRMFENQRLTNGSTLLVVTSGSAGVSLAMLSQLLKQDCGIDLRVVIVMPKAYSHKPGPQLCAAQPNVTVTHDQLDPDAHAQLLLLDGAFVDVLQQGKDLAASNGFLVLDQHHDVNGMLAHRSTAEELLVQMPDVTDVVCTTGTGATAAGLRAFLPSHVAVHARPALSGTIDGLTDVRPYRNFCESESLVGYESGFLDPEIANANRNELHELGIHCGPSSGAALAMSREIQEGNPESKIVFISACGRPSEQTR